MNPNGKAMIKSAEYLPSHEGPSHEYPFHLTTGRTLFHFHTRTKTGRAPQLVDAAPDVWVEISEADARSHAIGEGVLVDVTSPRGTISAKARVSGIRDGVLFVPFHYGYWDTDGDGPGRAANELTITDWDPMSKQPLFKTATARVTKVAAADGGPAPAPTNTAAAPVLSGVPSTSGGDQAAVDEQVEQGEGR